MYYSIYFKLQHRWGTSGLNYWWMTAKLLLLDICRYWNNQPRRFAPRFHRGVGSRCRERGWCLPASRARLSWRELALARFARSPRIKQKKWQKSAKKGTKKSTHPRKNLKFCMKNWKSSYLCGFWKKNSRPPTSPNFKTHKKIFLHFFTYIAI